MDIIKQFEPLFGKWYAEKQIGAGSFGRVYKIYREENGRRYYSALKYISIPAEENEIRQLRIDGMDDEAISVFFSSLAENVHSEISMMDRLKGHANIVSLADSRIIPKRGGIGYDIFIRMELLESLTGRLLYREMTVEETVKLGKDICSALIVCAENGIIHRDIKPDNIFVSQKGVYKLGDFGIARQLEKTATFMSKKGTYTYMAPEVYKGEKYGAACDIYSLGLVMYRLLNNGRLPFLPPAPEPIGPIDRENAIIRRMKGEPFAAPKNGSRALKQIVLKACAYDPKDRYASAEEMRYDLDRLNETAAERTVWRGAAGNPGNPADTDREKKAPDSSSKKFENHSYYRHDVQSEIKTAGGGAPGNTGSVKRPTQTNGTARASQTFVPRQSPGDEKSTAWKTPSGRDREEQTQYCIRCGARITPGVSHCQRCGAQQGSSPNKEHAASSGSKKVNVYETNAHKRSDEWRSTERESIESQKSGQLRKRIWILVASFSLLFIFLFVVLFIRFHISDNMQSAESETGAKTPEYAAAAKSGQSESEKPTPSPTPSPTRPVTPTPEPIEAPTAKSTDASTPGLRLPDGTKAGDIILFGSYEQDNNPYNGTEDIEWLVLAKEKDRVLVISRYALDCRPYNAKEQEVTWETCFLHGWLNDTFLNNAFSADEQAMIRTETVTADRNPSYGTSPGNDTTDKVFLLSIAEVNQYLTGESARKCQATAYAVKRGAYINPLDGNCWWWLRSPGMNSFLAAIVNYVGSVGYDGVRVHTWDGAVRPALWINIES